MDPEQTFIRVQERFSQILTPKVRAALEYLCLFIAITLFCVLVVMHANYVQQPGCSSELSGVKTTEAQLIQIKITSAGLWSQDEFPLSARETFKAAVIHFGKKWYRRISFLWKHLTKILGSILKLSNIAGIPLDLDISKWLRLLHLEKVKLYAVQLLEKHSKTFEPTYLYTMEKGYFLLPDDAKSQHNIHTVNISISARHPCFGNRWQQLLINRFVGYDTILMNSLLSSPGQGYLYIFQSKEIYNLSYAQEPPEGPARFGDYLVTKCGVLMMSLFVFFTTTMSVSFTLRETQTRMLKFTVQLQHHARHRLPTFQLIFVHVIESLVFVPIMIGILFFLFEFYDDQLLAFVVLILVWLSELFTLISTGLGIIASFLKSTFTKLYINHLFNIVGIKNLDAHYLYSMIPKLTFSVETKTECSERSDTYIDEVLSALLFVIFSGFSYLALSTTAAFMHHLILYFWNRFEVPALQRFMQNRRSQLQQHPDFQITSSTILASTLHITRLNTRNPGPANTDTATGPGLRAVPDQAAPANGAEPQFQGRTENDNPLHQMPGQGDPRQADNGDHSGTMSSFSSLLLWILGGASSESLNSFLSIFRDVRDQGQVYAESPPAEDQTNQDVR
ncbi:hypothetical protein G4B88_020113 [Cannabis sativa]|uniref:Membralin n=1 Tax=Cannabis sativa TaxID=3483 RepID=A0A7J6E5M3_CANSA|nr:hypothetical protein G4B88_020113 [Cannabis sativa]